MAEIKNVNHILMDATATNDNCIDILIYLCHQHRLCYKGEVKQAASCWRIVRVANFGNAVHPAISQNKALPAQLSLHRALCLMPALHG